MSSYPSRIQCGGDPTTQTQRKFMKPRSAVWNHFTKLVNDGQSKAKCNYCGREFFGDTKKNGTSSLKNHLNSCKPFLGSGDDKQKELSLKSLSGSDNSGSLSVWKFDEMVIRKAIAEMVITDEQPFKIVESAGFKKVLSVACPKFKMPSRWTISRDCMEIYMLEKKRLKHFLKTQANRISITTDTWTSLQRVNYMCITCHFIDTEWKLHKKILNFCPISSHKGEAIGRVLTDCLLDWGIKKISTITVDNASSNDVAVTYLKKKCLSWGTCIANGNYMHMRCIAHIINLVVQDGLKELDSSITWLRKAIKYIRSSPAKLLSFRKCSQECNVECKASLCLDVSTRWNSTYKMLNVAERYERVFDLFEMQDLGFREEVETRDNDGFAVIDWQAIRKKRNMLQLFYETTVRISGASYVTSNMFWTEISDLLGSIIEWTNSDDLEVKTMGMKMKIKFDKYWGACSKMNKLIFIATILDPREKCDIMEFAFCKIYGDEDGKELFKSVRDALFELFDEYRRMVEPSSNAANLLDKSSSNETEGGQTIVGIKRKSRGVFKEEYLKQKLGIEGIRDKKSELDLYLIEEIVEDSDDFDILRWWRVNSERFPILAHMARDILAVPVSTVASESAFSTGGRVLDAFRSSLTPKMAECLICTQNWLREDTLFNVEEDLEELENFETDLSRETTQNIQMVDADEDAFDNFHVDLHDE